MKSWKYLMLIPVLAGGLVVVSCQDQIKSEINETVKSAQSVDIPSEVSAKVQQLQKANPTREYIIAEVNEEGVKSFDGLNKSVDKSKSEIISISRLDSDKKTNGAIRKFIVIEKGTKDDALSHATPPTQQKSDSRPAFSLNGEEKIYDYVQDQPDFPGGQKAMAKFLSNELKYPSQARRMGVEGKVFIQFIVREDGKVTDVKAIKGIGAGCDQEAERVVSISPNWIPGKQDGKAVSVRFVVPIAFKL